MEAFAGLARHADRRLPDAEVRFRVWAMTAVVHQFVLRPQGCAEWLGADVSDKAQRDALLARLCALAVPSAESQEVEPRARRIASSSSAAAWPASRPASTPPAAATA